MSTTDDAPTNEFTTTGFIAKATMLAVVVLAGFFFALIFLFRGTPADVDTSTPACERPASTETDMYGAVTVEGYHPYGAAIVPITAHGPSTTTPAPGCYEHSPQGASAAAATIATLLTSGRTDIVVDHLVIDSPAVEELRQDTAGQATPRTIPDVVGTRIQDYDGDTTTVRVALEEPADTISVNRAALDIHLVWDDGDWKWDLPVRGVRPEKAYGLNGYNPYNTPQEGPAHG